MRKNKFLKIGIVLLIFLSLLFLMLNFQKSMFQTIFSDTIWVHRVNSLEKLDEAYEAFSGVEVDVVFESDSNEFDVNHPPSQSIGLSLDQYLESKNDWKDKGIWLDFKNLREENSDQALLRLNSITDKLNIRKESIIVESKNPSLLFPFKEVGYKTSFYLPSGISNWSKAKLAVLSKSIDDLMKENAIDFISTGVNDYDLIKEQFAEVKMLTWIIQDPPKIKGLYTLKQSISSFKNKLRILLDNQVEIVLFKYDSKYSNR